MTTDPELRHFSRLVDALRPWLGQIIFVGGWAHRLYRACPEAALLPYEPLTTDDADLALDPRGFEKSENIRARLIERGFVEDMTGDEKPPVTHYGLGAERAGFYAEFLTPLVGGAQRRDGSSDVTERVAGVVAQKLRYLEVLLIAPWSVTVSSESGFELPEPALIQIPNPVSYLVQKLLIHDRRKPLDRAKDVLYIHDTIELFADSLAKLRELWEASISPTLHSRTRRALNAQVEKSFARINDTTREAALMTSSRRLTPATVQELCRAGLHELLGEP